MQKVKQSGYRCSYYFETRNEILFVTICPKSEQFDIPITRLRDVLREMSFYF